MQVLGWVVLLGFYTVYLGKMALQRRQGIQTDQMAKGKRRDRVFYTELLLKVATYAVVAVEALCICFCGEDVPMAVRVVGVVLGLCGDALFAAAVMTMRDSWRAGLAREDQTELVTHGVYAISRNPAFLAFDLVYAGLLLMFFHWVLLLFTLWAAVMLHLQVLQEERYLVTAFGQPYQDYCKQVRRYLGRKRYGVMNGENA